MRALPFRLTRFIGREREIGELRALLGEQRLITLVEPGGAGKTRLARQDFGIRFVACFMQAVEDARFPDDPEFRAALRSYINWAVEEVILYSPSGAQVPAGIAVPRWSWNGPV